MNKPVPSSRSYACILIFLAVSVLLAAWGALVTGPVSLSLREALMDAESLAALVYWEIRLPRVLLGLLVGASLGLAGAAMQGLLRNPLAEPGILGVSNGAALGAVLVLYFAGGMAGLSYGLPLAAMGGALLSLLLVYLLAGVNGSILTLILAGVAVNAFFGALIALALNFAPSLYALQEIVFWLMGSLANRTFEHLTLAAPFALLGGALVLGRGRFLDALTLGEDTARSLGYAVGPNRALLLLGIALSVGACVAVSGSIGFVGLMVPHLLRPWVGYQPGRLLWASALAGALLVLLADSLVRELDATRELKLGVVTALLGGPFFLYLIIKTRQRWF